MIQVIASFPELTGAQRDAMGLLRRLESGTVLTGRVLRAGADGNTPIQVGNAHLSLRLSSPIDPGTLVSIRAEGGKIIVERQETPQQQPQTSPPLQGRTDPGLPLSQNLPASPAALRILQANNLPGQYQSLQIIQTVLGNIPADQVPLLAFLLAKNIPITTDNLIHVRDRLKARGNLGKELSRLTTEIRNLLNQGSIRGSENLASLLVRIQELLSWDQTGDLEDRVRQLREFLGTLEEKLLGGKTDSAKSDFKALLLELDFMLGQAELLPNHPLRSASRKIIHLLEGAQLSGLTQAIKPDPDAWVFWRIPFPGDPSPTMVELAVRGERDPDHPEQYDPKNLEILIQVDLSALGPVRVRVHSLNEILRISFTTSDVKIHDLLQKEVPVLAQVLTSLGFPNIISDFSVQSMTVGSLADELDPLRDWEKKIDRPIQQIDIRL